MKTHPQLLREQAIGQYGYVTAGDVRSLGLPAVTLGKLHARGTVEKVARGLYRFPDIPAVGHEQFAEAVLLVGRDAYLTHDAVLAFHNLGFVNPKRTRVGTPHRVRAALPRYVQMLRRELPGDALTSYEGIPSATVAQALTDCIGTVMTDRLRQALKDAAAEGLVTASAAARMRWAIRHHVQQPETAPER